MKRKRGTQGIYYVLAEKANFGYGHTLCNQHGAPVTVKDLRRISSMDLEKV